MTPGPTAATIGCASRSPPPRSPASRRLSWRRNARRSASPGSGSLRILEGRCPNLLTEAQLYRYGDDDSDTGPESPLSEHNHALDALRYLIATLDAHRLARPRHPFPDDPPPKPKPNLIFDHD